VSDHDRRLIGILVALTALFVVLMRLLS